MTLEDSPENHAKPVCFNNILGLQGYVYLKRLKPLQNAWYFSGNKKNQLSVAGGLSTPLNQPRLRIAIHEWVKEGSCAKNFTVGCRCWFLCITSDTTSWEIPGVTKRCDARDSVQMAGETQIGKKHGFMYSNKKTGRKKTGRIREGFYNFADNTVYSTYVKIAIYIYTLYIIYRIRHIHS